MIPDFPGWLGWVIAAPIVGTALFWLWKKILVPSYRLVKKIDKAFPLADTFFETFQSDPETMTILNEIVSQVRTDSGSSLLDIVIKLETASEKNAEVSHALQVSMEASKQKAELDDKRIERLIVEQSKLLDEMKRVGSRINGFHGEEV